MAVWVGVTLIAAAVQDAQRESRGARVTAREA
jgi:hypothetical protein